jgi:hypothetical protein
MDGVEQPHRFSRLVRLEAADAVKAQIVMGCEERRPFVEGFLDPAFTEVALARFD